MPQQLSTTGEQASSKAQKQQKAAWKRKLASSSRWLHIYLSMISFGVVFFFSITGITLNHQERFSGTQTTRQFTGSIDSKWMNRSAVNQLQVVETLRNNHGIRGAVNDFRVEPSQCSVSFKGPGYAADAFIDRATGKYQLNETRMGLIAILNDLHKGRDSGGSWSVVIDASAILLVLVSFTGIILLCYLHKRRFTGFAVAAAGAAICYLVYLVWVP